MTLHPILIFVKVTLSDGEKRPDFFYKIVTILQKLRVQNAYSGVKIIIWNPQLVSLDPVENPQTVNSKISFDQL